MQQVLNKFDLLGQIMGKSLQTFVDGVLATRQNQIKWTQFFEWGPMSYSTVFSVLEAEVELYPMASVIDVDSPKPKRAIQGLSLWNGEVPKIGHGYDLTEKDLRQYYIMIEAGGTVSTKPIFDLFYNTVNKTEFGIHARLNSMAMQIVSKGSLLVNAANNPDGTVLTKIDMKVPTTHKKYAGYDNGTAAAWTGSTATPLTDLQDMLDDADDASVPYDVLYFSKALWRTFLRHPNVLAAVNGTILSSGATAIITEAQLRTYMTDRGFPPVVIIDERTGLQTDGVTANVTSWDESNVVLAPFGPLGEVKNAKPISVNGTTTRTAFASEGRIKIVEKADDSRVTQGFEAECNAMPVLTLANYMYIMDTSTTTAWT